MSVVQRFLPMEGLEQEAAVGPEADVAHGADAVAVQRLAPRDRGTATHSMLGRAGSTLPATQWPESPRFLTFPCLKDAASHFISQTPPPTE